MSLAADERPEHAGVLDTKPAQLDFMSPKSVEDGLQIHIHESTKAHEEFLTSDCAALQRNVSVLLARHRVYLIRQHAQRADDLGPGFARLDHVVDETALGGDERIGEPLAKLFDLL